MRELDDAHETSRDQSQIPFLQSAKQGVRGGFGAWSLLREEGERGKGADDKSKAWARGS